MHSKLAAAGLAVALAVLPSAARAQTAPDSAADREAVLAVVTRLFDAMRQGDSAMLRSTFHPEARLGTAVVRNGTPALMLEKVDAFAQALGGKPADQVWDERIYNPVVHVDGPLASVWVEYDFYANDQFSHCGVDAFLLARTPEGWKIFSLADTRQRQGCPDRSAAGAAGGHGAHGSH